MPLLPSRSPVDRDAVEPDVRTLDEGGDRAFEVLTSDTARRLLRTLAEEPTVATELAEQVGTSLQNVHYHLGNLREAGVVEVAGTWYSEKGTEMKVYAPAAEPLMLVVGGEEAVDVCRSAIQELDPSPEATESRPPAE